MAAFAVSESKFVACVAALANKVTISPLVAVRLARIPTNADVKTLPPRLIVPGELTVIFPNVRLPLADKATGFPPAVAPSPTKI